MKDGRTVNLLAEGRLINLAAAEGHPSAVMDLSFADQALAAEYLSADETGELSNDVHVLPRELDQEVAMLKLKSVGITIDSPTDEQTRYLGSWEMGT